MQRRYRQKSKTVAPQKRTYVLQKSSYELNGNVDLAVLPNRNIYEKIFDSINIIKIKALKFILSSIIQVNVLKYNLTHKSLSNFL